MNADSSGDRLGERLAAEARAARPAFNAALHARLMAELPAVAVQPRRAIAVPFSMLRAAVLVGLMAGTGALSLAWSSKPSPETRSLAAGVSPVPSFEPRTALDEQAAEHSRRLLALARVKPIKMLSRLLATPSPAEEQVEQPEPLEVPSGVAAADGFSIRLISRAPFLDMQFGSSRAAGEYREPRN